MPNAARGRAKLLSDKIPLKNMKIDGTVLEMVDR
jgi:hypothetical protein